MLRAIRSTPGGHVGYVGVSHGVELPGQELFFSHVHLHGGLAPVRQQLPQLIDLIWNRAIDPGRVFDLELPLDRAADAYQAMDSRQAIKALLRPATGLQRNFTARQKESLDAAEAAGVFTYKTIEQGAATSIVAATAPQFAHSGGHYLDDAQEAYTVANDADHAQHPHGVKEWALDPTSAKRLWTVSTDVIRA
jgi:hypothetical protein